MVIIIAMILIVIIIIFNYYSIIINQFIKIINCLIMELYYRIN